MAGLLRMHSHVMNRLHCSAAVCAILMPLLPQLAWVAASSCRPLQGRMLQAGDQRASWHLRHLPALTRLSCLCCTAGVLWAAVHP